MKLKWDGWALEIKVKPTWCVIKCETISTSGFVWKDCKTVNNLLSEMVYNNFSFTNYSSADS